MRATATVILLVSMALPAGAFVEFSVNSTADETDATPGDGICETAPGNQVCTLRAAVQEGNHVDDSAVMIAIPAGTYPLTGARDEDEAQTGDLDIHPQTGRSIALQGAGVGLTIVNAQNVDRAFHLHKAVDPIHYSVWFFDLTIQNGDPGDAPGGAIYQPASSSTSLGLADVHVEYSRASSGGGVFALSGLYAERVELRNNEAVGGSDVGLGGGLRTGFATLIDTTVVDNSAAVAGGGIFQRGAGATFQSVDVRRNRASHGGGIAANNSPSLTIESSWVVDNQADASGSSIDAGEGGGIHASGSDLTISDTVVTGNSAVWYGGGLVAGGGTTLLLLERVELSGNAAGGVGGGLVSDRATVTVRDSTFSGNQCDTHGGGAYNNGSLTIVNTTISGNEAGRDGGGLTNSGVDEDVVAIVRNTTIAENLAEGYGGGIDARGAHTSVSIRNSIVAENSSTANPPNANCVGLIDDEGFNLADPSSGCPFGTLGNALLAPLGDYGGTTQTHVLLPGSSAIDGGDPSGCVDEQGAPLTADQRGRVRPRDGDGDGSAICDIGSVEQVPEPGVALVQATAALVLAALSRRRFVRSREGEDGAD